jgi:cytochrome c1
MRPFLAKAILATLSAAAVTKAVMGRQESPSHRRTLTSPDLSTDRLDPAQEFTRRHPLRPARSIVVISLLIMAGGVAAYIGYGYKVRLDRLDAAARLTGGDPKRGEVYLVAYGCAGCHTIPGVPRANGLVGPSLASVGQRVYVGGMLTNTPDNLVRWIVNPKAVNPSTAMPVTGISSREARDVVAYFYSR